MAATLEHILDAVEAPLAAIATLRVVTFTVDINVTGNASAAMVQCPDLPDYRSTMGRGIYELDVPIVVFTSATFDRVGQRRLAAFANQTGDQSIRAALEADQTLGGVVDNCHVKSFAQLGLEEVAAIGFYGGRFIVHIAARGV